eukprot:CAMPEP_0115188038 /NCGR_PEP_ID=MMETSP0270-20121206/10800_1 /TAXON_ID=71861 /ORGANISM="Scrippsiella trochoidea, Strain CCMP3099" /LENGTH=451 /DNA_ID=CAMNT_0002601199 /DNA_START=17 /DNA_END=1372 /DNA_ORIENTATION=-
MKQLALSKYAAEFIGTLILVFIIGCNAHAGSFAAALSIGSALTALVYTFGPISGGHLNPAVTFALALAGYEDLSRRDVVAYMVSQVLGGIVGSVLYFLILGDVLLVQPVGLYSGPQAAAIEIIYSTALCYTVLGVVAGGANAHFGFAIGATVTSACIAGGSISGCCLNPAVAAGSISVAAVKHGAVALHYHWMYVSAPLFGAALGAFAFFIAGGAINGADLNLRGMIKAADWNFTEDQLFSMRSSDYGSVLASYRAAAPETQAPANSLRVVRHSPLVLPRDVDSGECIGGVYFADKQNLENGLIHSGDEIVSKSPRAPVGSHRDNEYIRLKLSDVKAKVHALIFVVMIFGNGQETFGDVQQMCIRLVDVTMGDREICHFEKKDLHLQANALIAAMLYRQGDSWVFKAVDESYCIEQPHQSYRALEPQLKELVRKEVTPPVPPLRGLASASA